MVRRGLVQSRTEASRLISDGRVRVGGVASPKPATLISQQMEIRIEGPGRRYVSRGGLKLEAALEHFRIEVSGRRCLDVGASTGGFTDCLLQRNAQSVTALDVGYGQLDWSLRTDGRVEVLERVNIRNVRPEDVRAPFDVIVVDVSFISLRTIVEPLISLGADDTDYVLLVKPQFELGKGEVPRGGIVRDRSKHLTALEGVISDLGTHGLGVADVMPSPIPGGKGNIEFLARASLRPAAMSRAALEEVVSQ